MESAQTALHSLSRRRFLRSAFSCAWCAQGPGPLNPPHSRQAGVPRYRSPDWPDCRRSPRSSSPAWTTTARPAIGGAGRWPRQPGWTVLPDLAISHGEVATRVARVLRVQHGHRVSQCGPVGAKALAQVPKLVHVDGAACAVGLVRKPSRWKKASSRSAQAGLRKSRGR